MNMMMSQSTNQQLGSTRGSRTVRFAQQTEIYMIVSTAELAEEAGLAEGTCWHTREEYESIKRRAKRTVARARKGLPADGRRGGDEHCMRGLEHMRSALHLEQRKINKDMVIESVLSVQEAHWQEQAAVETSSSLSLDEESRAIALASERASRWARDLAVKAGASDEAKVRSMAQADARRCRSDVLEQALNVLSLNVKSKKHMSCAASSREMNISSSLSNEMSNIKPKGKAAVNVRTEKTNVNVRTEKIGISHEMQMTEMVSR